MTKIVAIVTGYGGHLGTGHIQRAVSIAWYLNTFRKVKCVIWARKPEALFPDEVLQYFAEPGSENPDLIIRDMRDSTVEEIKVLQRSASVLALDDIGEGRNAADWHIDLLPNPESEDINDFQFQQQHFVFGYNFLTSMLNQQTGEAGRVIDVFFYEGNSPDPWYVKKILGMLPKNSVCAVASNNKFQLFRDGVAADMAPCSYGELLLASKTVITHFGILVYEALLAGAGVITINPSRYHSSLADLIVQKSNIINMGTRDSFDENKFREHIVRMLRSAKTLKASPAAVYGEAMENLERFSQYILNCTG
jgi:spore coat polysaccharide biosynthesis predicted glycosyltransferase SpsG